MLTSNQLSVLKECDYDIEKLCQMIMDLRDKIADLELNLKSYKKEIDSLNSTIDDLKDDIKEIESR